MALEPNTNQNNPTPQDSGNEGGKEKLYAGKFKTVEEMEKGYIEAEKGFHETRQVRQEVKELRELFESRLAPVDDGEGYGRGGAGNYTPVATDPNTPSNGTQTLTRFYTDPDGFLRERDERNIAAAEQRIVTRQNKEAELRNRIVTWNGQNPDVAAYPDILEYWVKRTDGRLSPETRLDQAAVKVRERLVELRKGRQADGPNPGDHVEQPGGEGEHGQANLPVKLPASNPEAELAKYTAERNASRKTKRLGTAAAR